jgi:hypothetical protein
MSAPRVSSTRNALCSSNRITAALRNRARPVSASATAINARPCSRDKPTVAV